MVAEGKQVPDTSWCRLLIVYLLFIYLFLYLGWRTAIYWLWTNYLFYVFNDVQYILPSQESQLYIGTISTFLNFGTIFNKFTTGYADQTRMPSESFLRASLSEGYWNLEFGSELLVSTCSFSLQTFRFRERARATKQTTGQYYLKQTIFCFIRNTCQKGHF